METITKVAIKRTPEEVSAITTLTDMIEELAALTSPNDLILNDDGEVLFTKEDVSTLYSFLHAMYYSSGWEIEKGAPVGESSQPTHRQYKMTRTITVDLTEEAIEKMKALDKYCNTFEERTNFDSDEELISFLDEMYDDVELYKYVTYGSTSEIISK